MTGRFAGGSTNVANLSTGNEEESGGRPAFLFKCGDDAAITLDPIGANLPDCLSQWTLETQFLLGIRNVGLPHISPEPVIRGIAIRGFYLWRTSAPRGGTGTTQ